MKTRKSSKALLAIIVVSVVVLLLSVSCSSATASPPIPISAEKICPTAQPNFTWQGSTPPRLLYVIVEGNPEYQESADESLKVLASTLPKVAEPGDRLMITWMEEETINKAAFVDVAATMVPTPVFPDLPTPLPTKAVTAQAIEKPETNSGQVAATKRAVKTQVSISATETSTVNNYYCSIQDWQFRYQLAVTKWATARQDAIADYETQVSTQINQAEIGTHKYHAHLFEALQLAASTLRTECTNMGYSKCNLVLVVFSDVSDYRVGAATQAPQDVNLENIDVAVVLWKCKYTYADISECGQRVSSLKDVVAPFHQKSLTFISNQHVEQDLSSLLKR